MKPGEDDDDGTRDIPEVPPQDREQLNEGIVTPPQPPQKPSGN